MHRRHFNAMASAVSSALSALPVSTDNTDCEEIARDAIEGIAEELANICAEANPLFNRSRFLTACGL